MTTSQCWVVGRWPYGRTMNLTPPATHATQDTSDTRDRPRTTLDATEQAPIIDRPTLSLAEVTFVIVDLETTGGVPAECGITEIGAVKVIFGEVVSDFRTFCNPGMPIPPFITEMTGISNDHVRSAPTADVAVQDFLSWAELSSEHDTVLVAHNAPFDIGFLQHACSTHGLEWPTPPILDTLRLARKLLSRDEVPDKKLSTLASHFQAPTTPTHRALDDAMATVTVLHALLERVAGFGVEDPVTLLGYEWATPK